MIGCGIFIGVLAIHSAQTAPSTGQDVKANFTEAVNYLTRYGYLKESDGGTLLSMGDSNGPSSAVVLMRDALIKFQNFFNITMTGVIDEETLELMGKPRCGHKDMEDGEPMKPDARDGWTHSPVTWTLKNYTPDLLATTVESVITRALGEWDWYCGITFYGPMWSADIEVSFASGEHGDGLPFDGPYGVLAHAGFPPAGETHFDEAEDWTDGVNSGINLFQVALHEFGHAIGLDHSSNSDAVMWPAYTGYDPNYGLNWEDISRCQQLYG